MSDAAKIIIGIVVFVALFSFPLWYNRGKATPPPKLELPKKEKKCVEKTEWMRAYHMDLLDTWRDSVVRDAQRIYIATDGKSYTMSLQNTCMKCHVTKEKFCDRCHNYTDTDPRCWECHVQPEFKVQGQGGASDGQH